MRPIPRAMLTHSATLFAAQEDAYRTQTLTPVATLTRVRVERTETYETTKDNTQTKRSALLLYDARHSRPAGVSLAAGQWLAFEGKRYRVAAVESFFDNQRLHHIEAGLEG